MKKLALGIVVGTAALMAARVLHHEPPAAPTADVPPVASTTAAPRGDAAVASAEHSPAVRDPAAGTREPARLAPLPVVSNATKPDAQDWDTPCACAAAWYARNQEREEAARRAEAKDVYWAYETEQLLEQYFVAQPQARTIQISAVDCRTSFCEIKATGRADALQTFEAVVEQAPNEPWSTLGDNISVSSSSGDDGEWSYDAIIERTSVSAGSGAARLPSPEPRADAADCECATPEWLTRKFMHDEAARAAEPKDIDWAYGTEQELQQFIAGRQRAVMFEVSSIDCRTTYCEIRAIGLTDQSSDIFRAIIQEAAAQDRFGLTPNVESGSSGADGRIEMHARVRRKR